MTIVFQKNFIKDIKKQSQKIREKFNERLLIFEKDEVDPVLNNHPLKGNYLGFRSINVTGDLRAIFKVDGEKRVFTALDSRSNLYK